MALTIYKCNDCHWIGDQWELGVRVHPRSGDDNVCPHCGSLDYEEYDLIKEVK